MKLRPYQQQIISDLREKIKQGFRRIVIQLPTGGGKSAIAASVINLALEKNNNSFFIVHRRELVNQTSRALGHFNVDHGIIASNYPEDPSKSVQVCLIQSLRSRLSKIQHRPKIIIWDEVQHIASSTWESLMNEFKDAFHVGLTATPERLDGKGLGELFETMVTGPSVSKLIGQGFLSDFKVYAPPSINTDELRRKGSGDYSQKTILNVLGKSSITGDAIEQYKKHCHNKQAVAFCPSIEYSENLVRELNAAGIPAAHIDGSSNIRARDHHIREFSEGKIKILSNVDLITEGFDVPSIEAIILLRPTASLGLYLQMVGRALRTSKGKTHAIILDHVGNTERHGFVDDDRQWTLDSKKSYGPNNSNGPKIRVCKLCFLAVSIAHDVCPYCKAEFVKKPRSIKEIKGELVELQKQEKEQLKQTMRSEQSGARDLDSLIALGVKRGYKNPYKWAEHIVFSRKNKYARK